MKIILFIAAYCGLTCLALGAHGATITEQVALMQPGTWAKVTGTNTLASIDPEKDWRTNLNCKQNPLPSDPPCTASASYRGATGWKGAVEAYNGAVKAWNRGTCGTLIGLGGGHSDYHGSTVWELDPCGAQTWKRIGDPYDIKGIVGASPTGFFPDGSPQPPHTGQTLIWTGKELIVLLGQVDTDNPSWKPIMALFDPEKPKGQQWRRVENANSGAAWGVGLWDSKRKLACWQAYTGAAAYPGARQTYQCFDPATNAWTEYQKWADSQLNNYGALGGYNPELDLVTQLNIYKYSTARQFQIADRDNGNPLVNWKRGAMVNAPNLETELAGFGSLAWSDHRKAWIFFPDLAKTGGVYQIKTTLVGGLPTHTWSDKLNAPNSGMPACGNQPTCGAGSWNKFAVFTLGNSEALCGVLTVAGDVSCFKLAGAVTPPPPPGGPTCMPNEYIGLPPCGPVTPPTAFKCPADALWCEDFTKPLTGAFYTGSGGTPRLEAGRMVIDLPGHSDGNHGGLSELFPRVRPGETISWTYEREVDAATADLEGMKEIILKYTGESCQGGSFISGHYIERPRWLRPNMACGGVSFDKWTPDFKRLMLNGSGPPTDFDCDYQDKVANKPDVTNCVTTKPGVRQTYVGVIKMGQYGTPSSTVDLYQKNGAGPCLWYTHAENVEFVAGTGWEEALLLAYQTGRTAAEEHQAGAVYYDNFAGALRSLKTEICG